MIAFPLVVGCGVVKGDTITTGKQSWEHNR